VCLGVRNGVRCKNKEDYNEITKYVAMCDWSLTLREERKLRVFENMVLRRIFGTRRDEVIIGLINCRTQLSGG
jgi:hypothetical protein